MLWCCWLLYIKKGIRPGQTLLQSWRLSRLYLEQPWKITLVKQEKPIVLKLIVLATAAAVKPVQCVKRVKRLSKKQPLLYNYRHFDNSCWLLQNDVINFCSPLDVTSVTNNLCEKQQPLSKVNANNSTVTVIFPMNFYSNCVFIQRCDICCYCCVIVDVTTASCDAWWWRM